MQKGIQPGLLYCGLSMLRAAVLTAVSFESDVPFLRISEEAAQSNSAMRSRLPSRMNRDAMSLVDPCRNRVKRRRLARSACRSAHGKRQTGGDAAHR
jgi:hypothetical protein